jgi:cell wall-associated NlpC family hydrolase
MRLVTAFVVALAMALAAAPVSAQQAETGAAPATAVAEALVAVTVENMYSAPDDTKDVVSQATLGQRVSVLETQGAFARVRTPDAYEGWIPAAALTGGGSASRYARSGMVAEVTSLMANVYREADVTTARPVVLAPLATRLEVVSTGPGERWLSVRLPCGETAFVQRGDVRITEAVAPRLRGDGAAIVATARRFLGAPYLWGGMTAHGLDCSGLTSRVYHANGIDLPRDADLQFADGRLVSVERSALQAGDLLFFGRDAAHISHVGIYQGDGRFLNATTYQTPTVREDRLEDPHWAAIYQGARRPR